MSGSPCRRRSRVNGNSNQAGHAHQFLPVAEQDQATRQVPADRRAGAALRLQPQVQRLRQDPAAARPAAPAHAGRAGGRRDRGVRRADGVDRRRRTAHASADRRHGQRAGQAQEVRLPVHQRRARAQALGQVRLQAVAVLLLRHPHRRTSRAARRVGGQGRRVRRSRRGDQVPEGEGLPGHHQLHVLQHRHPADDHRRDELPQRRGQGRQHDDLARPTPTRRRPTRTTSSV